MEACDRLLRVEQQPVATRQFDLDVRAVGVGDFEAEQAVEIQRAPEVADHELDGGGNELVVHTSDGRHPATRRLEPIGQPYRGVAARLARFANSLLANPKFWQGV